MTLILSGPFHIHIHCIGTKCTNDFVSCILRQAYSPDVLLSETNQVGVIKVFVVAIKTMIALKTIEKAAAISEKHSPVILLSQVGSCRRTTELFMEAAQTTDYRAQVLHQAATLDINSVMFVVGTGGSITELRIQYICVIEFAKRL